MRLGIRLAFAFFLSAFPLAIPFADSGAAAAEPIHLNATSRPATTSSPASKAKCLRPESTSQSEDHLILSGVTTFIWAATMIAIAYITKLTIVKAYEIRFPPRNKT